MILIPEIGFKRSTQGSNVSANALADWLEGSILFDENVISKSDVVDVLIENQICSSDQRDLAHLIASEGWNELRRRSTWGGLSSEIVISSNNVRNDINWTDTPIRSFLLLLSILRIFPGWAKRHRDFVAQGDLFERVIETICPLLFPGWKVFRVGWGPNNTKDIGQIIDNLRSRIFVSGAADLSRWVPVNTKDGGLDIVCYRAFEDEREALPVFFLQCASGKNWRNKISTPDPNLWQKWMNSAVQPSTGIVAPFVIDEKELRIAALMGQIVVFDRLRLLSVTSNAKLKLPDRLYKDLIKWMCPRVADIPR